jgi:hypothetical protein
MESMSWDGTIYLNGDGGISYNGALLGCATGTGAPIAPSGYRFFSAGGYVGGIDGWAATTLGNTNHPGSWLGLVATEGFQFPSSYSAVVDGGNWRGHGMSQNASAGHVNGHIFNPYGAKDFFISGKAYAELNTSRDIGTTASAYLQLRLMSAGRYENVPQQSGIQPFVEGIASAAWHYTAGTAGVYQSNGVEGFFTGSAASVVPLSPQYPSVPMGIGVNSFSHSNSGDFTGYYGYTIPGGRSGESQGLIYKSRWWTASGFAPLSAY